MLCALTVCHDNSANTSQIHSDKDKHGIDWLSIKPEKKQSSQNANECCAVLTGCAGGDWQGDEVNGTKKEADSTGICASKRAVGDL